MSDEVQLNEKAIENLAAANRLLHPEQAAEDQEAGPVDPAERLYPSMGKVSKQQVKPSTEGGKSQAEILYPDRTREGRYPVNTDDHQVADCIRSTDGRILIQGSYHGDTEAMASAHANELGGADLSGLALAGKALDHGSLHDARLPTDCKGLSAKWANCKNLDAQSVDLSSANLAMSDCRGIRVNSETNIANADFGGSRLTAEDVAALRGCRGAASARGLVPNDWAGARV